MPLHVLRRIRRYSSFNSQIFAQRDKLCSSYFRRTFCREKWLRKYTCANSPRTRVRSIKSWLPEMRRENRETCRIENSWRGSRPIKRDIYLHAITTATTQLRLCSLSPNGNIIAVSLLLTSVFLATAPDKLRIVANDRRCNEKPYIGFKSAGES